MKFIKSFIDYVRIKWTIRKIKAKMVTISKTNVENKDDSIHR